MNFLDVAIVFILLVYVLRGMRRGFVLGVVDIIGFVFCVVVSLAGYRGLASLLQRGIRLRPETLQILSFFLLIIASTVLYTLIANSFLTAFHPGKFGPAPTARDLPALRPNLPTPRARRRVRSVNMFLGALPGLAQGAFVCLLLVTALALLPVPSGLLSQLENSALAARFRQASSRLAPSVEAYVPSTSTTPLIGVEAPTDERPLALRFPQDLQLTVDEDAGRKMLDLINSDRVGAGLRPLRMDPRLQEVARAHSREMFRLSYFAHESPRTGTPADRLRAADIPFLIAGENLAYQPNVAIAHRKLMESPGHRANLMSSRYRKVGIGIIRGGLYGEMFTQEFTD